MPIGTEHTEQSILNWLQSRFRFTCAIDSGALFSSLGLNSLSLLISAFHCVSLSDTFWIKHTNEINLHWDAVSPFKEKNTYSEYISIYALDGVQPQEIEGSLNNIYTPVISTAGSFPHTWKWINSKIYFIKGSSKYTLGGINSGQEPFSEYFTSQLCSYLNFNHVHYAIRKHTRYDNKIDIVTECECYTSESIGSVSAAVLGLHSYEDVIEYCKHLSDTDYKSILNMLFLDCLTLNTDRHFGNIEFLVDNDSLKVLGLAPIYDNNYSFLPRLLEYTDKFNRSEYIVRDNRSFEDLYKLVTNHRSYSKELQSLKTFKFKKPDNVEMRETRLEFLNKFIQMQVSYLQKLSLIN